MVSLNWPYIEGTSGWGPNTSAYEFCEMDYYMTPYIAEFINTTTNLGYIYLGIRGITNSLKGGNDRVVILCYASLIFLGIGSGAYHLNIKHETQMIDEVSMFCTTISILYGALSITLGGPALGICLTALTFYVSASHVIISDVPQFRRWFLSLIGISLAQCVYVVSTKVEDKKVKMEARRLARFGAVLLVIGFVSWIIDVKFCSHLTAIRSVVGLPWGFVTELHGWWHLLTGLAVYHFIVFIEQLRIHVRESSVKDPKAGRAKLVWLSYFTLPRIEIIGKQE